MILIFVRQKVLQQRRSLPVLRIVALQALAERDRHRPVEKRVLAINFFAPPPARIARQIRLRPPIHQNLAVVLRRLRDEPRLVSLHAARLLHQRRIPRIAHPRRLRKLRGGDRLPAEARLTLHDPVNSLGAADIRHAQPRHARSRSQHIDLLLRRHQRQQVVDALVLRHIWIVERILRLLREGGDEPGHQETSQCGKTSLCHVRDSVSAFVSSPGAAGADPAESRFSKRTKAITNTAAPVPAETFWVCLEARKRGPTEGRQGESLCTGSAARRQCLWTPWNPYAEELPESQ